ncbi:MAG: hypothetical protein ABIP51_13940 [Bacteroidia bacterium]
MNKRRVNGLNKIIAKFEIKSINTITITLSLLALVISVRTCNISNRAIEISEKQGQAFIQISDAKLVDTLNNASFLAIELTLKNLGQTPASSMSAEMDFYLGCIPNNIEGNTATRKEIPSMGQGFESKLILTSNRINLRDWKANGGRLYKTLFFFGTVFYKDNLTQINRKVDWTFELPLKNDKSLKQLNLTPPGTFFYQSKYKIQAQ